MICIQCKKEVCGEGLWCSIRCKHKFLLEQYSLPQLHMAVKNKITENNKHKKEAKKIYADMKKKGMTFTQYLLSLGDFKEGDLDEKASIN